MANPTPVQYPLINGYGHSWASIEVSITCDSTGKTLDLATAQGFSSINFKRTRSRSKAWGPHPKPLFKTRGQDDFTASIKFYLAVFNFMVLDTLGGAGYGDRFFTLTIKYLENGLDPVKVEIRGCTIDTDGADNAKGTDATEVECDLSPVDIIFNGVQDVDNPLAA